MPHVAILYKQFQKRTFNAVWAKSCLYQFNSHIQKIRDECDVLVVPPEITKRSFNIDSLRVAAREICDVIMMQCKERFSFTKHLEASSLLFVDNFPSYIKNFPKESLEEAVAAYPCLEKNALKTELDCLYGREDLIGKKDSLITILENITSNNLQSEFPNTVNLLKILITTPMTSAEAERCFSTSLAMISTENQLISNMGDFNEKVFQYIFK